MKPELITSLKSYKKRDITADLMSGLMVAVIALPMSIALGLQSGATIQSGIITSIIAGFVFALLGGCRYTVGSSTTAFVLVIYDYIINDKNVGLSGLAVCILASGLILAILSFLKVGNLIKYLSYPIITGFTAGVGLSLFVSQIKDFFSLRIEIHTDFFSIFVPKGLDTAHFVDKLIAYVKYANTANLFGILVGATALAAVIAIPKINKKIPASIVALTLGTVISLIISAASKNKFTVPTIGSAYGDVKAGVTLVDFAAFKDLNFRFLIVPTLIICFLGMTETLLCASVSDGLTGRMHNPNQELFAHGIANLLSGLLGGLPATGAAARTSANIGYGAKSPLSAVFHSVFLLVMYLLLMPVVKYVPLPALAAIIMGVAIRMANLRLFYRLAAFNIRDAVVLLSTFILTVFLGIVAGVAVGLSLSFLVNVQNFAIGLKIEKDDFSHFSDSQKFRAEKKVIYTLSGAVFFFNVVKIQRLVEELSKDFDEIVLDVANVHRMDTTSVEKLAKTARIMAKREKRLVLHSPQEKVRRRYIKAFVDIVRIWN